LKKKIDIENELRDEGLLPIENEEEKLSML
jgi:hypothetical protein